MAYAIFHAGQAFHKYRKGFISLKKARRSVLFSGGPEEIRTPDPYNANVMRSQLRYGPVIT